MGGAKGTSGLSGEEDVRDESLAVETGRPVGSVYGREEGDIRVVVEVTLLSGVTCETLSRDHRESSGGCKLSPRVENPRLDHGSGHGPCVLLSSHVHP